MPDKDCAVHVGGVIRTVPVPMPAGVGLAPPPQAPATAPATFLRPVTGETFVPAGVEPSVIDLRAWFGAEGRPGHTFWQAVDSTVLGAATAAIMKPVFGRARPSQTDDPGR